MGLAQERHRRAVRRHHRRAEVGLGVVEHDRAPARRDVDAHQVRSQSRIRCRDLPGRHDEAPVVAHVEPGVAKAAARGGGQVADPVRITPHVATPLPPRSKQQVRLGRAEVVVPVAHRVVGVKHRRDLGLLSERAQSRVVGHVERRGQQSGGGDGDVGVPCSTHAVDPADQCEFLGGLPAGRGESPQRCRLVSVLVGAWPGRDEQQVAVGAEGRRRLTLGASGQPPRGALARGVQFPKRTDEFGAVVVQFGDRRHHPRAVGRHREAGHPRQVQVGVEVVKRCRGHAPLVAQESAPVRDDLAATATPAAPTREIVAETRIAAFQPSVMSSPTCVAMTTNSVIPTAAPK